MYFTGKYRQIASSAKMSVILTFGGLPTKFKDLMLISTQNCHNAYTIQHTKE